MSDLPNALEWKFGAVADTARGIIIRWRHPTLPQPTDGEIAQLLLDFDAVAAKRERIAAARSATLAIMASWVWAQQYGTTADKSAAKAALDAIRAAYPDVSIADLRA